MGRFISKDPIGLLGGLNTFAYAPNPIYWIDPFGLQPKNRGGNKPKPEIEECPLPETVDFYQHTS